MSRDAGSAIPSLVMYHSLATSTYSLSDLRQRLRGLDDDRAVHAVGDVGENRLRPAVVHEDAWIARLEAERERVTRRDVLEGDVRGDPRCVEVDRVRNGGAVRQRHLHRLPLTDVDGGAGRAVAVEGPGVVLDARSDLDRHVLEGHLHLDEVPGRNGRQYRVGRHVSFGELRRVLGNDAGEAVQWKRGVVISVHCGSGLRIRRGRLRVVSRVPCVGPHGQAEEGEDGDSQPEEDCRDDRERTAPFAGAVRVGVRCHQFSSGQWVGVGASVAAPRFSAGAGTRCSTATARMISPMPVSSRAMPTTIPNSEICSAV